MKKRFSGIILILLLTGMLALAFRSQRVEGLESPTIEWSRTYGGTEEDVPWSVIQTDDGGYALAGRTNSFGAGGYDFWLVKTDRDGNMQWNRTYGSEGNEKAEGGVVQTSDGGYLLVGHKGVEPNRDMWVVKTDLHGNMLWNRTYGGPRCDTGRGAVLADDGGYAVFGNTRSFGAGNYDFWLVKTDVDGKMEWNQTYGEGNVELAASLIRTSDGGYALAGRTRSFGAGWVDFWLVKTNSTGGMEWNQTYGTTNFEAAYAVVQSSDGGYALAGQKGILSPAEDYWLVKTNETGDEEWSKTYDLSQEHVLSMVQTEPDKGYAMVGLTESFGVGNQDFWFVKTDASGNHEWNQRYGGSSNDVATSVVQTDDGGYVLAGRTESFSSGSSDFWLIKLEGAPFQSRAIWLYNFENQDPSQLVSNLISLEIKTVFLSLEGEKILSKTDGEVTYVLDGDYVNKIKNFIKEAASEGLHVHAMVAQMNGSECSWYNAGRVLNATREFEWVIRYNQAYPETVFVGVHIDTEPYADNENWRVDDPEGDEEARALNFTVDNGILEVYVSWLRSLRNILTFHGSDLWFSAAHPHFYEDMAEDAAEVGVDFSNGRTLQFAEFLDAIVLMAYDSGVYGPWDEPIEIQDLASKEIAAADNSELRVVIGFGVLEFIRANKNQQEMTDCMESVEVYFRGNRSYLGNSIFEYALYKNWEELEQLNDFIMNLPDDVFVTDDPEEFVEFKKDISDKIDETLEELSENKYVEAIEKLNDLREEVIGEEKLPPATQSDLCVIIDHIISSIETLQNA